MGRARQRGATAQGVTADTITIAVYQEQPDLLQETFLQQSGTDESLATELQTLQAYTDFFQAHYEMYGRTVRLVAVKASGAADDDVAAKSDAIKVATEIKAFASWGGPSQTSAYADELASRGVMCLGDCLIAQPESFIASRAPAHLAAARRARAGGAALGRVRRRRPGRSHGAMHAGAAALRGERAGSGSCATTTTPGPSAAASTGSARSSTGAGCTSTSTSPTSSTCSARRRRRARSSRS